MWSQTSGMSITWKVVRSTNSPAPPPAGWLNPNLWGRVPRVFAQALLFLMNAKLGNHCKDSLFRSPKKAREINENAVCLKMFQKKNNVSIVKCFINFLPDSISNHFF